MKNKKFAKRKVPTKEEIRKILTNSPKRQDISKVKFEEQMLDAIIGDIVSSQEIILREEQRIKKIKKSLRRWLDVIYADSSKKAKEIGMRYCEDRLNYLLNDLENKFFNGRNY